MSDGNGDGEGTLIEGDEIVTLGNRIFKDGKEFIFRGATRWDGSVGGDSAFSESRYHSLFRGLRALNLNTVRLYMNWVKFVKNSGFRQDLRRILDIANDYDMNVIYVGDKTNYGVKSVWFYPPYAPSDFGVPHRDALIPNYASKWLEFTGYNNFFLEFFNEPMVGAGFSKTIEGLRVWEADCQAMITYLRNNGFEAPIILHWAFGTSYPTGNPDGILTNMNWYKHTSFTGSNLIYAQGNYRYHGAIGSDISNRNARPTDRESILEALEGHAILYAKERDPVLIYECGTHEDIRGTDDIWFNNLLKILDERGISWMAHGYTTNKPWGFRGTSTEDVIRLRASDPQPN